MSLNDRQQLNKVYLVTAILFAVMVYVFVAAYTGEKAKNVYTLDGGTFDISVTVIVTEDTAYARKYINDNLHVDVNTEDFDSRGTTFPSVEGYPTIVWLPRADNISIINHELLHATIDIMRRVGIPLDDNTEEAYTYELQYLSNQFDKIRK